MTTPVPTPHDRIAELFGKLVDLAPAERAAALDQACVGQPDGQVVRAEVESLLAAHDAAAGAMDTPASGLFEVGGGQRDAFGAGLRGVRDAEMGGSLPERIGQYRILGLLGEGGMGVVYLAESERPRRRVALKVIRPGMASRSLLQRFEQEVQVLAMLQHPGIAQVYEAGSAEGLGGFGGGKTPYFAMELVRGLPLSEHVRSHGLDVRDRIELVARICDAVQHAHERGVVHRDLKPANILVQEARTAGSTGAGGESATRTTSAGADDRIGQPKILDFGVARITDREQQVTTIATGVGQLVGTLAYMSPEQVAGDPAGVGARSDIYALGVILYELLGGRAPLDLRSKSVPEAVRAIRDDDPPHLSTIDRSLRGDLDTIVSKAMEKEPLRRYGSAGDLAAELRRHLGDEPIEARPPSAMYQATKFARRNRGLVAGIGVAIAVLLGSTVVLALVAREAVRQRDLARAAGERNKELAAEAERERAGAEREAKLARKINAFFNDMLVQAHPKLAQGKETTLADAAERVEAEIETAFAEEPIVRDQLHHTLGKILEGQGRYAKAIEHFERCVKLRAARLGPEHREVLEGRSSLAAALRNAGRVDESARMIDEDLPAIERLLPDDRLRMLQLQRQALNRGSQGRMGEAEALCRDALSLATSEAERIKLESTLIGILMNAGRREEADALSDAVLPRARRELNARDPDLLSTLQQCAQVKAGQRAYTQAEAIFRECAEAAKLVYGPTHPATYGFMDSVAGAISMQGRFEEAEKLCREVVAGRRATLGAEHPSTVASLGNLGWLLNTSERPAEAEPIVREVMEIFERMHTIRHPSTLNACNNYGGVLAKLERWSEAEALYQRIVPIADEVLPEGHSERYRYRYCLARSWLRLGRAEEAIPMLELVYEAINHLPREKNMARQSSGLLAEAYETLGRAEDAKRWAEVSAKHTTP